jgi:crotonobetainyl-CoA:carnitine CoA-transferase CaiB-like acyl-CoA transferase
LISFSPHEQGPLNGVRIVDLSRLVAGNMLTSVLGDFGAEVIKVEKPGTGDPLRDWRVGGVSVHWKVYARNKKSLTLDLRNERGKELLLELISTAQVLVENFRPGTLEAMGLAPELLHHRNPGLVIVRVSGWGQSGPYSSRPGFGTLVEAMSGFASMNGFEDREPVLPPLSMADMVAGLYGAMSTLVALRHREVQGGQGQVIDLPLFDPLISILGPEAAIYKQTGTPKKRTGSRSNTASPRNVYGTKDGRWLAISGSMQAMAERIFRVIGKPELIDDPRFASNTSRLENVEELDAILQEHIGERTLAENLELFTEAKVTAAPVYDIGQLIEDPHVKERQVIVELPDDEMEGVPMHNVIPHLSASPGSIRTAAPRLGEHNRVVLEELGVSDEELERLTNEGVL